MPRSTSPIEWPIIGTWKVKGHPETYEGVLFTESGEANLRIFLEIPGESQWQLGNRFEDHPRLAPFRQPRLTVFGETNVAGKVTLLNCMLSGHQATHQFDPPIYRVEVMLRVSQAWAGERFVDHGALYGGMTFTAPGLHSVLSASRLISKWLIASTPDHESDTHDLKALTGADEAFLFFRGIEPSAEIANDGKPYKIVFSTSVRRVSSSTEGDVVETTDFISIDTTGATLSELMNVAYQVEQFLSLLCIGPFRGTRIEVAIDEIRKAELIWSYGRESRSDLLKMMPHQILASIGRCPELVAPALSSWFGASESRRLARWLIFDSLFKETSSTAKFLAVAQAWEILGRDKVDAAAYDKKQYEKACEAARVAFEAQLGTVAGKRLYDLVRSSNRKSFGDMVRAIISDMPRLAVQTLCPDVDVFVAAVVRARNVLTHMDGNKKLPIEKASYLSLFLTYKLIVLFCIYDCVELGLPLDNHPMMLANNHMARAASRPLPNL
jgi:hypothetical protein